MAEPPKDRFIDTPFQVGKYLASVSSRPLEGGGFPIRSAAGSATYDRAMRFAPVFDTHDRAARFASQRILARLGRTVPEFQPSTMFQE